MWGKPRRQRGLFISCHLGLECFAIRSAHWRAHYSPQRTKGYGVTFNVIRSVEPLIPERLLDFWYLLQKCHIKQLTILSIPHVTSQSQGRICFPWGHYAMDHEAFASPVWLNWSSPVQLQHWLPVYSTLWYIPVFRMHMAWSKSKLKVRNDKNRLHTDDSTWKWDKGPCASTWTI